MIVTPSKEPVSYPAVHGGSGPPLLWRCFARRGMVYSEIEGFESARMPPGAAIADHTHTRTDEIYLVTRGHGQMTLDGQAYDVGPGDLVMLPRTHSHGLVNIGDEELEIIVLEFLPAEVADRLPPRRPAL
ncbi:MAG: cupin domain-containing protein [Solirubrobacteraceae bacterium]